MRHFNQRTTNFVLILVIVAAAFFAYQKWFNKADTFHGVLESPTGGAEVVCSYQSVAVTSQNQNGDSCSITLANGTTIPLTCDQLVNYPVSSEISVSVCK